MDRPKTSPICALHASPEGQVLIELVGSQPIAQAQFWPHGLSGLPQPPTSLPSSQLGFQHTCSARACPKQAPLFTPHTPFGPQSASEVQPPPVGQTAQLPPQSMSVSSLSRTPLPQWVGVPPVQPGACGFAMQGSWHVPLATGEAGRAVVTGLATRARALATHGLAAAIRAHGAGAACGLYGAVGLASVAADDDALEAFHD